MKATGIVRRMDDLGRIVIPRDVRRELMVKEGDPLEFYVDTVQGTIVLRPHNNSYSTKIENIKAALEEEDFGLSTKREVLSHLAIVKELLDEADV